MKPKEINGVKVMSSYTPEDRPTYEKWFKKMKISPMSWYDNPDGKRKADRIMENVGLDIEPKTPRERVLDSLMGM
jgi:hypothetical protein